MRRSTRLLTLGSVVLLVGAAGMAIVMLVGLGAGACFKLLVPSIDLGMATLAGILALLVVLYAFCQFVQLAIQAQVTAEPSDEDLDDDASDEQVKDVADRVADAIAERIMKSGGKRGGRSRNPTRSR